MRSPRRDPLLIGYLLVALAALSLTSVASFEFFSYLLPPALALAATVVLAAGLPLLKFAAHFDRERGQTYGQWLWGFLAVELIAQYFKAQASFAIKVGEQTALAGTDIASAAGNGFFSRVLAFVFLASLPFVVVGMCHAAAERWRVLHAQLVRKGWSRFTRLLARDRRLRAMLAGLRAELANLRATITDHDSAVASLRAQLTTALAQLAETQAALTQRDAQVTNLHTQLTMTSRSLAERDEQITSLRTDVAATSRLLAERDYTLAEQDNQIATLRTNLTTTTRALTERERTLAEWEQTITMLRDDLAQERARPILTADAAIRMLIAAGAPEGTIRGWLTTGRVQLQLNDQEVTS